MNTLTLSFNTVNELTGVASSLFATFPNERFFAFFGKMGVGKTTLIKELCSLLGVRQNVCSPTFAIINEYSAASGDPIYHFDFYRMRSADEAYDIGYEEYFYSGYYCFTEWTEVVEPLLPDHYVRVELSETDGERHLEATLIEP